MMTPDAIRAALRPLVDEIRSLGIRAERLVHHPNIEHRPWTLELRSYTRDIPEVFVCRRLREVLPTVYIASARSFTPKAKAEPAPHGGPRAALAGAR